MTLPLQYNTPVYFWLCYNYLRFKNREDKKLEAIEIARKAVEIASDKQATDIVLLDVRDVVSFADYFVICSGESGRQISAVYEEMMHSLKKEGITPRHREGTAESGWLLLDYIDVIIHIFISDARQYYQLDELWEQAKTVVRIQ